MKKFITNRMEFRLTRCRFNASIIIIRQHTKDASNPSIESWENVNESRGVVPKQLYMRRNYIDFITSISNNSKQRNQFAFWHTCMGAGARSAKKLLIVRFNKVFIWDIVIWGILFHLIKHAFRLETLLCCVMSNVAALEARTSFTFNTLFDHRICLAPFYSFEPYLVYPRSVGCAIQENVLTSIRVPRSEIMKFIWRIIYYYFGSDAPADRRTTHHAHTQTHDSTYNDFDIRFHFNETTWNWNKRARNDHIAREW